MPIYDYACTSCGHHFEHMHEMNSVNQLKCPSCGSSAVSKLVSVPGLVRTSARRPQGGQTCCGRSERCDKPPCSSGGQCHR